MKMNGVEIRNFTQLRQKLFYLWDYWRSPLWNHFCLLCCKILGNMPLTYPPPLYFIPNNLQIYLGWRLDHPTNSQILGFFKASHTQYHCQSQTRICGYCKHVPKTIFCLPPLPKCLLKYWECPGG